MPATTGIKALFFRVAHAAKFRYLKKGRKVSELMSRAKIYPMVQAILSSVLFGASAPIAKLLLGQIEPVVLAAFLYLGSGIGLLLFKGFRRMWLHCGEVEARISSTDIPWLIGSILAGGVLAPIVLMFSLRNTPASTASLLLNFEGVATTLIAYLVFKEAVGKRIWLAVASITTASIILSWNTGGGWGFSLGAAGVIGACILWGMDNNFTHNISTKDPLIIVTIKGLAAGSFSLILALLLHNSLPNYKVMLLAMSLGCLSYGASIILFIMAMRNLGAARTSALFGTAPFTGALLSFALFKDSPGIPFFIALPFMIIGAALLLSEEHTHNHCHAMINHEHRHSHEDGHHKHQHPNDAVSRNACHSHFHIHDAVEHSHHHTPDIHHWHNH
ncbi:MAG: EamA family transporter [Thermincola sp.]|nr:EamA family transporter [Thermincola sp.]MDT3703121.1 EamA family transporter [Thermincola sp.]